MKKLKITTVVLLLTMSVYSQYQQYKIQGIVQDEKANNITGAKILTVDGNVTYTDFDGSFEINSIYCQGVIEISYLGCIPKYIRYYFDNLLIMDFKKIRLNKK
jgi:hypothetical protein